MKTQKIFVYVSEEEKEAVRELSFRLRLSETVIVQAIAMPTLLRLRDELTEDKIDQTRETLLSRVPSFGD